MKKSSAFLFACALVLVTGVLSSCSKEEKLVLYSFHCDVTGILYTLYLRNNQSIGL